MCIVVNCQVRWNTFILLSLNVARVEAQTPGPGAHFEVGFTRLAIASTNQYRDNILDPQRDDGTSFNASILFHDTTNHGRGLGRISIGLGLGVLWWDQETLMPVFGQVNWYPFIRSRPWAGIHLDRMGIMLRYGAVFGAWKETTRGQLRGWSITDLAFRYPFWSRGRSSAWVDGGIGMLLMRGPYTIEEEGVVEDRRMAEFIYPRVAVGLRF